jgi:hypothetical protein
MPWIYPNAFQDADLEEKICTNLKEMGITIIRECKLIEILTDKENTSRSSQKSLSHDISQDGVESWGQLERIVLKRMDIPDEEEEEDEFEQDEKSNNSGDDTPNGKAQGGAMEDSNLMENDDMS